MALNESGILEQFRAALRARGLEPSRVIADGEMHRCPVEGGKKRKLDGAYLLHLDGIPAGGFENWRDGRGWENWRADLGRQLSAAEEDQLRARVEASRNARQAQEAQLRRQARDRAGELWKAAQKPSKEHPYLAAKKVGPHGLRQIRAQLVVPVRDVEGQIHGLQFIDEGGGKRFLTGTAKAGHYHAIGPKAVDLVAIAEGYATGATVHEATGWPVAVAFDAGNLEPVARTLRSKLPKALIIIAADNDRATDGNPGLTSAAAAAAVCSGVVAAPEFQSGEAGSDWNDFAAVRGVDATRLALLSHAKASPIEQGAPPGPVNGTPRPGVSFFEVNERGLWWHGADKHGDPQPASYIGPPIKVIAHLRDGEEDNWGRLVEFPDARDIKHRWGLPARILVNQEIVVAELLRQGYSLQPRRFNRERLLDYLGDRHKGAPFARSTERTGWHEQVYVRPEGTIGKSEEAIFFQSETLPAKIYQQRGTLDEWRANISDLCRRNSRLVFVVSAAFASILMRWADEPSGGFHLRGDSSIGKTTALKVAASVFGADDYIRTWRATDNALEAVAAQHSDALLVLDEIAQVDGRIVGDVVYMLANESGKSRAHKAGGLRSVHRWRLLFLSSGETSLAELMREGGRRIKAGQETRLADIPADAGAGRGLFDDLRGWSDSAVFARELSQNAALYCGTAAPAFIGALVPLLAELPARLQRERREFGKAFLPSSADGQAVRVASRFGLVASAGELATELGITGWEKGEARAAAESALRAWLVQRGGAGNLEPELMLAQVREFIELHGDAAFSPWSGGGMSDETKWVTRDRAGFRRVEGYGEQQNTFYYVLAEPFRTKLCAGFDHRAVADLLNTRGILKRGEGRNLMRRERLPGLGNPRCYVIDAGKLFAGTEDETRGDPTSQSERSEQSEHAS